MYDEYYGLSARPFQLTPNQRFFFDSQVHHRALAYLRYGIEQREGFIVITGGIGTGKTTLVQALFGELEGRDIMAAQLVTTQVEPEDMLRMVSASFGLAHEGMNKATLLHNLEVIARTRFAEGKRILLVVDEAQNLPARSLEELRMLANFQVDGRPLFQSFLLGQSELRATLQAPQMEQLRQRIIAAYHLEPLSPEETRAYVEFRLGQVGWSGNPELPDEVFDRIYHHARGVPRRINSLCDRLFLYGCIESKQALGADDVEVVAAEIGDELGRVERSDAESPPVPGREVPASTMQPHAGPIPHDDLSARLSALEHEVATLRAVVQHERKLLRKAVLLQLDLDAYDDID